MDIVTIIVALILVFIAWKVLVGLVKVAAIVAVIAATVWFLSSGGFGV